MTKKTCQERCSVLHYVWTLQAYLIRKKGDSITYRRQSTKLLSVIWREQWFYRKTKSSMRLKSNLWLLGPIGQTQTMRNSLTRRTRAFLMMGTTKFLTKWNLCVAIVSKRESNSTNLMKFRLQWLGRIMMKTIVFRRNLVSWLRRATSQIIYSKSSICHKICATVTSTLKWWALSTRCKRSNVQCGPGKTYSPPHWLKSKHLGLSTRLVMSESGRKG